MGTHVCKAAYDAVILQAQSFGKHCCWLRYLGFKPTWVRYATSTPDKPDLPKKQLKEGACKPGYWKESFQKSDFGQVLQNLMALHMCNLAPTGLVPSGKCGNGVALLYA